MKFPNLFGKNPGEKKLMNFQLENFQPMASLLLSAAGTMICYLVSKMIYGPWIGLQLLPVFIFIFGFRYVKQMYNGLLNVGGSRTGIGFREGWVWIPWFLGAWLQMINVHDRSHEVPRQDTFARKGIMMKYIAALRYSVKPVEWRGYFRNMFGFFICLFNRVKNAEGLFNYARLDEKDGASEEEKDNARELLTTVSMAAIGSELLKFYWYELLNDTDFDGATGAPIPREELCEKILNVTNIAAQKFGMEVTTFSFRDLDVHEDTRKILQQRTEKGSEALSQEIYYSGIGKAANALSQYGSGVAGVAMEIAKLDVIARGGEAGGSIVQVAQSLLSKLLGKELPALEEGLIVPR